MRFIDLFAGLGGFHLALAKLGHKCVFASELDPGLRELYGRNHQLHPAGDIREVVVEDIPSHDILCAGFPCQPFSKAGDQKGFDCPKWGDLFEFVLNAIEHHKPTYFILENVPNIRKHDKGRTWNAILEQLNNPDWGYEINAEGLLSPHQFGIPHIRQRAFIVGSRKGLSDFRWPKPTGEKPFLDNILSPDPELDRTIPSHYLACMDIWQEFLDQYPASKKLPSFPIWSMEFGATYDYEETTPWAMLQDPVLRKKLPQSKGSHGISLKGLTEDELLARLPSHARTPQKRFPKWKIRFIRQNRELYESLKPWIDDWIPKIVPFASSLQKLEWNYKGADPRNIWRYVVQFRASGVRVKKNTTAPSLVAMTTTQIPIVGKNRDTKRYMTMRECARLQSMDSLKYLPTSQSLAIKALGNAVNVELVQMIATALLNGSAVGEGQSDSERFSGDGQVGEPAKLAKSTVQPSH